MGRNYRIFFSHSGRDTYFAENLFQPGVERTGAKLFLDAGEIKYGDDFRSRLLQELELCDELLVFLSASALERPWVFAEIGAAVILNKRIVAIVYDIDEVELQKKGILSILGTNTIMPINRFDDYLEQLAKRVEEASHG